MCSKSQLGNITPLISNSGGGGMTGVSAISAGLVKANPDKYTLVNVLEPEEDFENGAELPVGAVKISLGKLLKLAYDAQLDTTEWYKKDKTIVTICNVGKRAEVAARELASNGYTATYVTRGMFEWTHPAATKPDLIITLQSANPEQVTLAIVAAKVNQESGSQSVLVCMGEGVMPFRLAKAANCDVNETVEGITAPDPLPPAGKVWKLFQDLGGITLICTTCTKVRGLEPSAFQPGTSLFGMPDYLRMQKEAQAALTFA